MTLFKKKDYLDQQIISIHSFYINSSQRIITHAIVPMALLNGLRDASGVSVLSSAAKSNEFILRLESDIPHAEPCLKTERGVAATSTDRYLSCSNVDDVVSEVDTPR